MKYEEESLDNEFSSLEYQLLEEKRLLLEAKEELELEFIKNESVEQSDEQQKESVINESQKNESKVKD